MEIDPCEIALQVMSGYVNRAFTIATESTWYEACKRDDVAEELNIGFYHPFEEGTYGEFSLEWTIMGGKTFARLKMFDDFWHLLPLMSDFMALLTENGSSSDENSVYSIAFVDKLKALGFVDHTSRAGDPEKPREPDYEGQRLRARQPQRISETFQHLFDPKLPFLVGFSGTTTFEKGVLIKNPEISAFVETNCQHGWRCYKNDVLFESEEDALLVQMRFS